MDLMECPHCLFPICEPVTVPCGHTFCRRCAAGSLPSKCPLCKERLKQKEVRSTKNNVLLIGIAEKCWPQETRMKGQIQEKLRASEFTEALRMATEALRLVPDNPSLKLFRAEANLGLLRFSDALMDLDYLCCLQPNWTEGFFRKGNVLLEMGQQKEALIQFHHCLKLQADFVAAKSQIKKVLQVEGIAVPEEVPCILQLVSDYLKEPPITTLSGSQAPTQGEGKNPNMERREAHKVKIQDAPCSEVSPAKRMKHEAGTECCLSLCQAVSFLPAGEEDEEMMMRKEECQGRGESKAGREKTLAVLTVSDFECPLCIRLFFEPVTTPCGHTFCKNCIERSLDHNVRCPLCKQPLQEVNSRQTGDFMSRFLISVSCLSCSLTRDIPIFVCTVAFPGVPCPLHIFEPRYRLMMRRCMETGTKKFGMCSYEHGKGFADYGCMLEILDMERLPDGRSYVETVGGSRFRVLKRGQRDGYHTADIEYLEDVKVEGSELELLQHLHDSVYQQAQDWYQRVGSRSREHINRQHGSMPDKEADIQASPHGPAWCWWLLSVLQLDPAYQTTFLSLTSLKDRLGHLRLVLEYFSQS
ncbi:LON peptidase N-terminal domain and RING finger protein 1 [Cyprinodon tularosa]|uniref:LON peptidase N-terminal domain and RING finger protein 1 n=1 Tax=Cyprinodon tularosa TaxID=77115 RepID=UPI0018E1FE36|nr:LON peptidase N-terminal domain and RING finger protein 1 [Cyprinodon tularosa]